MAHTAAPRHRIAASSHRRVIASPRHRIIARRITASRTPHRRITPAASSQ
jgi:hypothetical protein